ncbi:hypothetical protein ACS0TY_017508 [Phlomoides rotata]
MVQIFSLQFCSQVQGTRCSAVFDLQKSGVRALKFINNSSQLIIGYECCRTQLLGQMLYYVLTTGAGKQTLGEA